MGAEGSTTARARRKQQRSTRSARQHLPPPSCAHEGGPPRGRSHTGQSRPPAAGSAPRSPGPAALLGRGRIFSGRNDAPGVGCIAVRQRGARLPEGVGAARREPSARREGRGWAGAARAYVREGGKEGKEEGGQHAPPPLGPSLPGLRAAVWQERRRRRRRRKRKEEKERSELPAGICTV